MHVTFDGSLLLPRIEQFSSLESSVSEFNKVLGYLIVGGVYFGAIEPTDVDYGVLYKTGYYRSYGHAAGYVGRIRIALRSKIAGPWNAVLLYKPNWLLAEDIQNGFDVGKGICAKIPTLSTEFLVHGISAFIVHDWGPSLSHLWIAVEQIVDHLWEKYVVNGQHQPDIPNGRRRKFLADNRTWTTAARTELLFQMNILLSATYRLLDVARKARNDLIHSGKHPNRQQCKASLEGVFQLIACAANLDIEFFNDHLAAYEKLEPIQRHFGERNPVPVKELGGIWLGPFPPIPGEKEWGEKPFENVFEQRNRSTGSQKEP